MAENRDSLAELRARMNGEQSPFGTAASFPVSPLRPEPEGFDAGDVWVFPYNLNPYADAKGHVPPPTQARIDRFMRSMAKLVLEYDRASRQAEEAREKAEAATPDGGASEDPPPSIDEMLAEVDAAMEEKSAAVGKVKGAIADLCSGHPTRKQLDKLPEYALMRFASALGRKLNPEV